MKKNIFLLGIVSFLNDVSSEMIMPILPMFILALEGNGLIVGLIGGLRDSISSILKVFAGYWSDKSGKRKVFVFLGYLTSALFKLLLGFSKIWHHILIFASLERIGKGLRTAPRDAIIAESLPKERGTGFGIHRAMDTLGAILGSIAVFFLFWFFGLDFRSIILMASILAFLSLIPLHFVKERKRKPQRINLKIGLKNLPKSLKLFILISGIFAMANFSYMFFILKAQEVFQGKLAVGIPILLYILFNIFYAGFAVPFGKLSDKIGRRRIIAFGYLLFSLTCLGFAFFQLVDSIYNPIRSLRHGLRCNRWESKGIRFRFISRRIKSNCIGNIPYGIGINSITGKHRSRIFMANKPENAVSLRFNNRSYFSYFVGFFRRLS